MHHTLTHVTQLDVCPPRRRHGPRRRQVLPPSTPSQPIHTETWQITQIDSRKMSLYHRRPQRKRKTPSCGTHWGLFFSLCVYFYLHYIVNFFILFYYYEQIIIYLNENMINFKLITLTYSNPTI